MQVFILLVLLTLLVFLFDIDIIKAVKDGLNSFSKNLKSFWANLAKYKVILTALKKSFLKLNPLYTLKNPLVFIVELGAIIITAITFTYAIKFQDYSFNLQLAIWLWVSVFCSNFIESLAEDKDSKDTDQANKKKTYVNRISKNGKVESVPIILLKKGDLILLRKNEKVPCQGLLFSGIALIDESSICGSSIPVVKEADTPRNVIYQGTTVLYGSIKLKITSNQVLTIFDQFLNIHEYTKKNKNPDEAAIDSILVGLAIIFLGIIFLLVIFADYSKVIISTSALIALFVCLLPTTVGGLLPAIGPSSVQEFSKKNPLSTQFDLDKSLRNNLFTSPVSASFNQSYNAINTAQAQKHPFGYYYANSRLEGMKEGTNNISAQTNKHTLYTNEYIGADAAAIGSYANKIDFEYMLAGALNILGLAKQILMARGNLVAFSLAYDISKYFAIIPALCASQHPMAGFFSIIQLASIKSAVLSVVIFNALIIVSLTPFSMPEKVSFQSANMLKNTIKNYGLLGVLLPIICIKIINVLVVHLHLA